MARFCTACGTRHDDEAVFCEECGRVLRSAAVAASLGHVQSLLAIEQPPVSARPRPARARWVLPAVLGTVMLIAAVGGIAWWSSPPPASAGAFASALKGAAASLVPSADLLCFPNLPYDRPQLNVDARDFNTRRWMDGLASASLYTAGEPVQ